MYYHIRWREQFNIMKIWGSWNEQLAIYYKGIFSIVDAFDLPRASNHLQVILYKV